MDANVESCDSPSGEDEPKLKYEQLGNDVASIVAADSVSCVCVHPKLVVVGTAWGRVHVLDHAGNAAGAGGEAGAHAVAVNALSVDGAGEWVGSCADDGRVRVAPLAGDEAPVTLSLARPVRAIALHPNYGSERCFLTGDDCVRLHERTFLGRVRSVEICRVEEGGVGVCVGGVCWGGGGRWGAAAGGRGVRVIDTRGRCSLGLVQWEAVPPGARCSLLWTDDATLMIAWGDTIRVCRVRRRTAAERAARDGSSHLVDPVYTFRTDYLLGGVAPLGEQLAVLGVPKGAGDGAGDGRPVLAVCDYATSHFAEVSTDTLNIRGYEATPPAAYQLQALPQEHRYFIVAPKDIVVASPYDADDRVGWLVSHGRWERALAALEAAGGRTAHHSLVEVGARYADELRAQGEYSAAAALCARVCRAERALWEPQLAAFAAAGQLRAVAGYVPRDPDRALPPQLYELVLSEALRLEPALFLRLVRDWSPRLYRTPLVVKALLDHMLTTAVDRHLHLEALALLYCHQRKYDKALNAYLKLQHKDVFALIAQHKLYDVIHDKILELMTLDVERALAVLVERTPQAVPVEVVVRQLQEHPYLLFRYLEAHARAHPAASHAHHGALVALYAQFAPDRLLSFLRSSDRYPIQAALDVCRAAGLHAETVFLLGRMGSARDALAIIVDQLRDMPRAIAFCQEHGDRELWAELIRRTVHRPECVTLLLQRMASHVDPRMVIAQVGDGVRIERLQEALLKMLADCGLRLAAAGAATAVTHADHFGLHARLVGAGARGWPVADGARCPACRGRLLPPREPAPSPLLLRACRHHYHARCLPPAPIPPCQLCQPPAANANATTAATQPHNPS